MRLAQLRIENLRNIAALDVALAPGINVFVGPNGAGKSSLLEAAYLLSHAQSFRAGAVDDLIRRGQSRLAVAATAQNLRRERRLTLIRAQGAWSGRIDQEAVSQLGELLRETAAVCFEPGSHELISGAGRGRCRFLDWGVFHVEHAYLADMARYRRLLRQRNAALKRQASDDELSVWDTELARAAEPITRQRLAYVARFGTYLSATLALFLPELGDSSFQWQSGWPDDSDLAVVLAQRRSQDRARGHTSRGPHRADWSIRFAAAPQREHLSRGQEKLCALACALTQARVHADACGEWPVIALDDFASELDLEHQQRVLQWLRQGAEQVLISGVEMPTALREQTSSVQTFHVEHGALRGLL